MHLRLFETYPRTLKNRHLRPRYTERKKKKKKKVMSSDEEEEGRKSQRRI